MRKVLRFLVGAFLVVAAFVFYNVVAAYMVDTAIYECSEVMTKTPDKSWSNHAIYQNNTEQMVDAGGALRWMAPIGNSKHHRTPTPDYSRYNAS